MAESIGLFPSSEDSANSSGMFRSINGTWSNGQGINVQIQSGYGALVSIIEGTGSYLYYATIVCGSGKSVSALLSGGSVHLRVSVSQSGNVNIRCTWESTYIDGVDNPVVGIVPLTPF